MKILNKLSVFGATLLLAASIAFVGSVYAEEGDMTQTRDQDRVRDEVNLQTPASDSGQARIREEKTVRNEGKQEQKEYKYKYKYKYQKGQNNGQSSNGASAMNRQTPSRSTFGGRN